LRKETLILKAGIYALDKITGGIAQRVFLGLKSRRFHSTFEFGFKLDTLNGQMSQLSRLAEKYGTDKGGKSRNIHFDWEPHNYADFYDLLFFGRRNMVQNILEVGTGSNDELVKGGMGAKAKPGASLFMWRDYFPNGEVYGADIDPKALIFDERIKCFQVDQTDPKSVKNLADALPSELDLIIDDGLHEFHAAITLFEGLRELMTGQSLYVIEDTHVSDLVRYRNYFENQAGLEVSFVEGLRPEGNLADNRLILIRKC
jgi:hypothetical protein